MKRRRSSFNRAFILLLLCLLCGLAWGRSYLPQHLATHSEQGLLVLVFWQGSDANEALFDRETGAGPGALDLWRRLRVVDSQRRGPHFEWLGFGTVGGQLRPFTVRLVAIPWWSLTLLTGVASLVLGGRGFRDRRRLRAGRCLNCGYDLRATPARCPECGEMPGPRPTLARASDAATEPFRRPLGITVGTDEQIRGILNGGGLRTRTPG